MNGLTKAAQDVLAERQRQRDKWGDGHDDRHTNDSLAYGAVSYLLPGQKMMPADWSYKSKVIDSDPRRDQLVKGAALALAAVEQFDRAHGVGGKPLMPSESPHGSLHAGVPPSAVPLDRAADFLEQYADFIRRDVMSVDIERHPYLPELEQVAADVRAAVCVNVDRGGEHGT
jgi:hypothetical protein